MKNGRKGSLKHYVELTGLLVKTRLKLKYAQSYLGMIWSLLNPLLTMVILTIVFSTAFKNNIANYPVYLMCGRLIFECNAQCTRDAMHSIVSNGQLIKKVYVPKFVFPLSSVISAFTQMLFSVAALAIVMVATRAPIHVTLLLSWVPLVYLFFFALGLGFFLSALNVFFRDMEHLYSVITTAWMYMTPIFYPADIIPVQFSFLLKFNPLHHFIQMFRDIVVSGTLPSVRENLICVGFCIIMMVVGVLTFRKTQDDFVLHV